MASSLKQKATSGFIWTAVDKFASRFVKLGIGIILARLLLPEDFGLIGMLAVFIGISQSFVNSGMGSGLIQKQDRTDADFSTVFVFNLVVSTLFYVLLFFTAPFIADFYDEPRLVNITRVLSLNIIINALAIVQRSRLEIDIDFKSLTKVNITGTIVSGTIAILAANYGYGVWALVIQQIVNAFVTVTVLWSLNKWKPSILFSKESFRALFGFGSKLMLASIYAQAFQNIYNITIGKYYNAGDLGFYNRAKSLSDIPSDTVSNILLQVTYPILSSLQNDKVRMVSVYKRMIKMSAFLIIPTMILIALLAEPLIRVLLTDKWLPSVILLQWIAIARITYPISVINMGVLNAMGRSDLFLKVDLSKAPVILISLFITIPISVEAMVIGFFINSYIAFFINAYLPGKLLGYGGMQQLRDMLPYLVPTIGMIAVVMGVSYLLENNYAQLILGGLLGLGSYLLLSHLLKINELKEIKAVIVEQKNHKKS
ncbi:lipopolysaccharide biosynthesis protein [Phaeodactylibacter xiamenensis]|uniref:lipopolysaccharide biosynthesis protein n=1 Tax=Phaeodactylibacter xiamenensis TaxID=1524460 RepID=UPI0024A843A0|nr:lipopolysaccharide biosynthesis protein [Phaeodactylibacter xiamenensis]